MTPQKMTRVFAQLTSRNYSPLVQIYDSHYGCQSFDSGQEVYLNSHLQRQKIAHNF